MEKTSISAGGKSFPLTKVHTLVIGSGAAGLNAAVQLKQQGIDDVLIVTEGLQKGTSINTGSDKQTYYKLSLCGADADAPRLMADNYYEGGSMHGDLALVEASLSVRAFVNLVNIGVPFPQDKFGQFIGYKTDHDPRQRATSIGPYTSRDMCRSLIKEVERQGIAVQEDCNIVKLVTVGKGDEKRIAGAVALNRDAEPEAFVAENVVFATGGPGGIYKTSVYPGVHTGGIGLALMEGAAAQSLPESQYGLASIKFRWNVSGTYMQVIPKFISTEADGVSDAKEFLPEYFKSVGEMNSMVFLKGYQWPFDSRKVNGGSSLIDIFVYIETEVKGRRVFLDFRENPAGFTFEDLSDEAREYLENSKALQDTPIARLHQMNPGAIELYLDNNIDVWKEPLEVAVCAQHNNGGLAANHWWESSNIGHLFPVGEVNGSHGVYRPGGSALNSGQVGSIRAAVFIANKYKEWSLDENLAKAALEDAVSDVSRWLAGCDSAPKSWQEERQELQERMSRAGAHIRSASEIEKAIEEAKGQWKRINESGCKGDSARAKVEALRNRQLCFAHMLYLESLLFMIKSGVGSRGSAMVLDKAGSLPHATLGDEWRYASEDQAYRGKVQETVAEAGGIENRWIERREIPESDTWFETAWAAYRNGEIYE
ncbi:MAG: FAD-binding protein [Planctomycetes bacterium]|nr:FAD-binding protein [Planctomycetota bacterium]